MIDIIKQRQIISSYFNCIRFIQAKTSKERATVESIRDFVKVSRTTADKIVNELKLIGAINDKLNINAIYSVFMGISISYDGIQISIVGLNGQEFSWKEIFKSNKEIEMLNGRIDAAYSINGLIKASIQINEIIMETKKILPLRAICFSFDDVDLTNNTFCYPNYLDNSEYQEYNIYDFCKVFIQSITTDILIQLECNAMSQLIEKEFPMIENPNTSIYVDIQKIGIFAALLINNKICYGYNSQSIRLCKLLDKQEIISLKEGIMSLEEISNIIKQIINPYAATINPSLISISGPIVSTNSRAFDYIIFEKEKIIEKCGARNYRPEFRIITNSNYSKGAAISAMYHYYNWDGTSIKHF